MQAKHLFYGACAVSCREVGMRGRTSQSNRNGKRISCHPSLHEAVSSGEMLGSVWEWRSRRFPTSKRFSRNELIGHPWSIGHLQVYWVCSECGLDPAPRLLEQLLANQTARRIRSTCEGDTSMSWRPSQQMQLLRLHLWNCTFAKDLREMSVLMSCLVSALDNQNDSLLIGWK